MAFLRALIAVFLSIVVGIILLAAVGYNPLVVYWNLLLGIFSQSGYIANAIVQSNVIILTGFSVAFAFRTGLFNIGAEGQYIVGVLSVAVVGLYLPTTIPAWIAIIILILVGIAAGFIWGGIAGFLKAYFGINEVVVTIMLNWIALYLNNYVTKMPKFDPTDSGMMPSIPDKFTDNFFHPAWIQSHSQFLHQHPILSGFITSPLHYGIFISIIVAVLFYFVLQKTVFGYRIKAVGFNVHAAEYAGVNIKLYRFLALAIAGGIAGLAGATQVLGVPFHDAYQLPLMEGYGYNGIAVALMGASSSIGVIIAGLFLGSILYASQFLQGALNMPAETIKVLVGLMILFLAVPFNFVFFRKLKKNNKNNQLKNNGLKKDLTDLSKTSATKQGGQ